MSFDARALPGETKLYHAAGELLTGHVCKVRSSFRQSKKRHEEQMPDYRAYRLDDAGKFIGCQDFEAANDAEALEVVRLFPDELGFEVWTGARMVGRIGRFDKEVSVTWPEGAAPQDDLTNG
jgi:hypothetical protein